jgi:predicted site-specific integrase-resolvase
MSEAKMYTELSASEALGISRKTLIRHRRTGKINPTRFGGCWLYSQSDLDGWRAKYAAGVAEKQARLLGSRQVQLA